MGSVVSRLVAQVWQPYRGGSAKST